MELTLARGANERTRGAFPPWRQENVLIEATKTDPKGFNILSRPPLAEANNWGTGPVQGIFQRPGLFGGDTFVVSGGTLYRNGVSEGAINGTGPVWWAGGNGELCVGRGQSAYSYNGTNLAAIAFPDGADVRSGNWMARRFIFVRKASGRFYWSDLDDARTVDALSFATAESEPDELYDIKKTGDVFAMMGAHSIESWVLTGDADLPWSRVTQRTFERGVRDTGCAEEIEGGVFFISDDGMVCALLDSTPRISDAALEEKIRQSSSATTFWFQYEGKTLLCLRLDAGTYVLDLAMDNLPSVFSTQGRDHWAPLCAANINAEPLFGDDTDGTVWSFDESSSTDSGNAEHPRVFSAGLALAKQPQPISNLIVSGNNGSAQVETGEAGDPILEMRYSRDAGRSWSDWRGARWGAMGEYKRRARFGTCGMFHPPGFLAEFRLLACAPLRIDSVRANESLAGRGW
jgi:hypothetical protein